MFTRSTISITEFFLILFLLQLPSPFIISLLFLSNYHLKVSLLYSVFSKINYQNIFSITRIILLSTRFNASKIFQFSSIFKTAHSFKSSFKKCQRSFLITFLFSPHIFTFFFPLFKTPFQFLVFLYYHLLVQVFSRRKKEN